ncbi:dipeptide ABC transporter ATP-binding protein [Candidatus Liberibacter americanus]|uniref:Dipeptide transport ATP-binding protein DppD n=1 Tax=Candidatus Liberibacter americanus str. Sao Paulo TaxID=1261131 RepID=U6B5C4_9HYPH|nr:dipeptide ABC transporter ATP-binding protein [Candidatus Liberibacter americanus]AHA28135.1 Dipeptide transport ATP-binding protein DppD [Candidatus Liberibacter americanus str. Sao Paulo]EMS36018.1 dipeptide transporter ATP-binding subunit [Candidatus Liberibacter americanus PW_SP]
MALLDVENLFVSFGDKKSSFRAVDNVSYQVEEGEIIGIVGESGSGKSVSSLAIMGLIDNHGHVVADVLNFNGQDLLKMTVKERSKLVGSGIAMVFQDPMTSLNPCFTVGYQIIEAIKIHQRCDRHSRYKLAIELLTMVEIPDPISCFSCYPHQLSGGMNQRVIIAMALACKPKLLIVDEPTTALDVTIQAQIMDLLLRLHKKNNMALILITHDLALVAQSVDHIIVMYAGQVVESGKAKDVFSVPRHPYTQALLRSLPEFAINKQRLDSLPGVVPGKYNRPNGCLLNSRCPYVMEKCLINEPSFNVISDRKVKCHSYLDDNGKLKI